MSSHPAACTACRPAPCAATARRAPHKAWHAKGSISAPHRRGLAARSAPEYKELLHTLRGLSDEELAAWAAEAAHRERLSLPFLSWLSDDELAASAGDPDEQQMLWELGSKLMALREGLSPVGNEVLQAELRAAALRCAGLDGGSSSEEDEQQQQEEEERGGQQAERAEQERRPQDAQQQAAGQAQQQAQAQQAAAAALVSPAFGSAVQAAAALGLSPEGLALFQQQAAALEAVVGTARARSLTEVIGRARVQDARQVQQLAQADAAVRILDVLLSVHDRDERAAMLPDAFTPPCSSAAVDDDASYFSPDEDQVFTTPLRLLQAIDLYLARLQGGSAAASTAMRRPLPALTGGGLGLSAAQLQAVLRELREDVEAYWQPGDGDAC